jgi:hypothetical protein
MKIQGGKFLTFTLAEEIYGIPLKTAKEIVGMQEITTIPKTKKYIKGVMNLRGQNHPHYRSSFKIRHDGECIQRPHLYYRDRDDF